MDLRSKLTLDGSDFSKTMNEAAGQVNDFSKKAEDANKAVGDMGKVSKRTASELLNQMKQMEGLGRSSANYRQQLGQISKQIQDLTINYRSMSTEMKNSDFGREVAAKLQELKGKAAEYKDAIMDAQNSVKLLASDTANLDAAKMGIEGLSAAMTLVSSAGILGADSTEKLVKVMAKLKAIEASTNAVIKIANVLNKDNILMLKLRTIWTNAQTKAQLANNTATNNGAKAIKTLTTAIKSCPYAIVATAILAIIAAYITWSEKTHQQIEMQRKLGRRLEEDTETMKKYGEAVGTSVGKAISQFEILADKFKALDTFKEKQKFLEDYSKEMENLGLHAKNVNDLENIFINNVDDYKAAIEMKAEYLALQGLIEEAYADYYKKAATASKQGARYQKGDRLTNVQEYFDLNNLIEGVDYTVIDRDFYGKIVAELTGPGAKKLSGAMTQTFNEAAGAGARQAVQTYLDRIGEIENDPRYKLIHGGGGGGGGNTPRTTESTPESGPEVGSAAYYDKLIAEQNKKLREQVHTKEEILEIEQAIYRLTILRDKALGKEAPNLIPQLPKNAPVPKIKTKLEVEEVEFADVTFYDLNKGISDAIGGLSSMNSAVQSITNSVKALNEGWDYEKSDIENITAGVGNFLNILQSVTSIINTMNTLSEVFTGLSMTQWMLEKKKNSEKAKGLILEQAETGVKAENAGLGVIEAIAGVIKSASEIPMVGWILGLAAVAGVIALIASAPKFAKGGIVPGSSFSGDNITAQVNSGEMILNTNQQRRLFDMLDGKGSVGAAGGKVEFVIKGQELKGVLNNYDKKLSRI